LSTQNGIFGLLFIIVSYLTYKIVYHLGPDFEFYSMFVKVPDLRITIILLNNT